MSTSKNIDIIKNHVKTYPDFPKPGVLFRDIFSVMQVPEAFNALQEVLLDHVKRLTPQVQVVIALESRGFLFGPIIALQLGIPFVPIRKKGKLPGEIKQIAFSLEYGLDVFEIQSESIQKGQHILIVDDLIATGGSLQAACELLRQLGAEVVECLVVMELVHLKGRDNVTAPVHSIIQY